MTELELLKRELSIEIQRCIDLVNTHVLTEHQIFSQSAFIEILIRLNYVLQKLSQKSNRVVWIDDVQTNENIVDITDLVNNLRNAACHIDSKENFISNTTIKFVFNVFSGRCPNAFSIADGISLGNEYEDDVAFYYGDKRIYLVRHIKRLLEELPGAINCLT